MFVHIKILKYIYVLKKQKITFERNNAYTPYLNINS